MSDEPIIEHAIQIPESFAIPPPPKGPGGVATRCCACCPCRCKNPRPAPEDQSWIETEGT